jgi:hypothetical protein
MAGLVPAIRVDPRDEPGDDDLTYPKRLPAFRRRAGETPTVRKEGYLPSGALS